MKFLGEQFGIEIMESNESGPVLQLLSEDDEHWHEVDTFSAFWLNDLITILQTVQGHLLYGPHGGNDGEEEEAHS